MEDDKKRKKNKKKKNKQNKAKEDTAMGAEEKDSSDQQHCSEVDAPSQVSENAFASDDISGISNGDNGDVPINEAEKSGNNLNESEALETAETERKHWLQREAMLQETVNRLQSEKDTHLKTEAQLEMRLVELEHEKESLLLKQASMEGTISQLLTEKTNAMANQTNLEDMIGQLIEDKALLTSKLAEYEERIKHIERDENTWVSEEAKLQETIKNLEVDKDSLILKQTSNEEWVGMLRDDNARLQSQVNELEESKIRILHENQILSEKVSGLQVEIQNGDTLSHKENENSEVSVLNSQIEAASHLIEKLVTENADLVEKVNKLYTELDRLGTPSRVGSTQSTLPDSSSSAAIDDSAVSDTTDEIKKSLQTDRTESTKIHQVQAASDVTDAPVTIDSGEIVQIPSSESESQEQDAEGQQTADEEEESPVELSDAPLTGAPIRFISFVARYVSGADLISKNPTNFRK